MKCIVIGFLALLCIFIPPYLAHIYVFPDVEYYRLVFIWVGICGVMGILLFVISK